MIQGVFRRDKNQMIQSFELNGHADAGPYGSDIVCAAVSALSVSAVNGIEALAKFTPIVEVEEEEGGYLYMELPTEITTEQMNIAQILLENLLLALQGISIENAEFIQLNIQE